MKSIYEDLPAALVSATLCIAAASMFVVIFANMAWGRRRAQDRQRHASARAAQRPGRPRLERAARGARRSSSSSACV